MLDTLHATAEYFQNVVEEARKRRFDPEKIKSLEEKIRVTANDAEHVVQQTMARIIEGLSLTFEDLPEDLLPVVEKMDTTKKEAKEILSGFSTSTHDEILELSGDSLIGTSSTSMLPNSENDIVQGLDDDLEIIARRLTGTPSDLDIVTITGMGGIGKTTLARKAYNHLPIRYHFDLRIWVTISQEFQLRNVLLEALYCISYCISKHTNTVNRDDYDKKDDNDLADLLRRNLMSRRYLVVVDDIWSTDVWDSISGIFQDRKKGSRILLTTRETEVAMYVNTSSPHEMNLLNLENGWKLLHDKVGPKQDHSPELEEIGKKIVEKCQGLPLTISVIGGHLSKTARTLECWKDVAQTLSEIVASHPDKCLGVLGLSYHHLPIHLKPCFLSMACFPEDFQVEARRLIHLWIAEGFVRMSGSGKSLEEVAVDYLEDLISRNLIMLRKRRFNSEIKTCAMHDLLRKFCLIDAENTKFIHVERTDQVLPLPTQKHNVRRFSFQTRFCVDEHCCKPLPLFTRSIYIFSPSKYVCFSRLNLLRVLAFPTTHLDLSPYPFDITHLSHLRYLEVLRWTSLPASISELQNLQTLIQHDPYRNEYATLPGTIWLMKNLRHVNLGGSSYLPSPRSESIQNKQLEIWMPNLEELSCVCSRSCTNEVFSGIPNLKRLIIHVNYLKEEFLANRLIDMSSLTKLEALKCFRGNLRAKYWPLSMKRFVFPTSLTRLTLTGFEFTWEDISTLVMLPNLEELKLKHYSVVDEEWRLSDEDKFKSLKLLLFSSLDIQRWEASSDSFPNLKCLVLKYCRFLEAIPTDFMDICTLESIELHDCSTTAGDSARKIKEEHDEMGNNFLKIYVHDQCKCLSKRILKLNLRDNHPNAEFLMYILKSKALLLCFYQLLNLCFRNKHV